MGEKFFLWVGTGKIFHLVGNGGAWISKDLGDFSLVMDIHEEKSFFFFFREKKEQEEKMKKGFLGWFSQKITKQKC